MSRMNIYKSYYIIGRIAWNHMKDRRLISQGPVSKLWFFQPSVMLQHIQLNVIDDIRGKLHIT